MTREEAINYLKSSGVRIRMTRTEAINYLKSSGMSEKQIETVINALTCEDCISREEAEAIFKNARKSLYELSRKEQVKDFQTREMMFLNAEQFIHLLPSVTPKFTDSEIQKMQDLEQAQLDKAYELGKAEMQPCKDYISKAALLEKIDEERKHLLALKMDGAEHILVHHARRIIEDMPAVTPKVGHWTYCPDDNGEPEEYPACWCSQCFEYAPSLPNDKIARYCPNCGCRMVEP